MNCAEADRLIARTSRGRSRPDSFASVPETSADLPCSFAGVRGCPVGERSGRRGREFKSPPPDSGKSAGQRRFSGLADPRPAAGAEVAIPRPSRGRAAAHGTQRSEDDPGIAHDKARQKPRALRSGGRAGEAGHRASGADSSTTMTPTVALVKVRARRVRVIERRRPRTAAGRGS